MEEETCPVCRTDTFLNPSLRLLVPPCLHRLCSNCVTRLYSRGSAPCPTCGVTLRKSAFAESAFADVQVEKEVRIRRRLAALGVAGQPESSFISAREYNDYLERIEVIVQELMGLTDAVKLQERLEQIRKVFGVAKNTDIPILSDEASLRAVNPSVKDDDHELPILMELEEERKKRREERERAVEDLAHGRIRFKPPVPSDGPSEKKQRMTVAVEQYEAVDMAISMPINNMHPLNLSMVCLAGGMSDNLCKRMLWYYGTISFQK